MACPASRAPAAVLVAHAERHQGLHPAGRAGPGVRAAPGQLRAERPAVARLPVTQSEQQDSRHPRPGRSRWPAAGAVRVGRHPAVPGGKTGKFLPQDAGLRYETIQWLMFQMGGIGPMFGQVGFFHKFAGKDYADKRPLERYLGEARRLLAVLEQRLQGRDWIMGSQYTIADIAIFPWVRCLVGFYGAGDLVGFGNFPNVQRALDAFLARPAVIKGVDIPSRG